MYFSTHKFIVLFYFIKTQNSIVLNNNSKKKNRGYCAPRFFFINKPKIFIWF